MCSFLIVAFDTSLIKLCNSGIFYAYIINRHLYIFLITY